MKTNNDNRVGDTFKIMIGPEKGQTFKAIEYGEDVRDGKEIVYKERIEGLNVYFTLGDGAINLSATDRQSTKPTGQIKTYESIQETEAATWLIENEAQRNEKAQRERIRYKKILKDMNLWGRGSLDTTNMTVLDVGCGPLGGVSTLMTANMIVRADPLMEEYKKYFHVDNGIADKAETIDYSLYDLVIATNCIDHFESPDNFFTQLDSTAKYSTYFAHYHAINNAVTHPHEAHVHNINQEMVYTYLNNDWELVWELDYATDGLTYAWRKQPAFSQLWRRITK